MPTANYENKDRRIAWLSTFSSLCANSGKKDYFKLAEDAFKLVEKLYQKFPFPYIGSKEKAKKSQAQQKKADEIGEEIKEEEEKKRLEEMENIPVIEVEEEITPLEAEEKNIKIEE